MARTLSGSKRESGAKLGFEATLRHSADPLRNTMDAADPKPVVPGLIFFNRAIREKSLSLQGDAIGTHRILPRRKAK